MATLSFSRGGRPRIHPIPHDRYRLTTTKSTVVVLFVVDDEVHCRYADSDETEEVLFSLRWLLGNADLQYKRRGRA
jgi:hypothetical protein